MPVLVDFWAEWCGRHAVAPVLDRIVAERESELKLVKVNIDSEHELSQRYGVASIPTMILFRTASPPALRRDAEERSSLAGLAAALPDSPPCCEPRKPLAALRDRTGGPPEA
jgi:thioredoxin 1